MHFCLFPPVADSKINLLPKVPRIVIPIVSSPCRFLNQNQHILLRSSSPIASSKGAKAILLAACKLVEAVEKKGLEGASVDLYSEKEDNDVFLNQCSFDNKSFCKEGNSNNENKWDDENDNDQVS